MLRAVVACIGLCYAHDYHAFLEHSKRAQALRPSHGGSIYALASAYALSGDDARAIQTLRRFASLGYFADIAADSDLTVLRASPGYARVRREMETNRRSVVRSRVAFTLPEKDLLTEGIAYDPGRKAFFVGSVHHRKIVRVDSTGHAADWVGPARDGLWAPLGMKVDAARGALWVAAAAGRGHPRTVSRLSPAHLGAGTGTHARRAYALPCRLLADYSRGILKIDLVSKSVALLPCNSRVLALGIDGLYLVRGKLVGVQNGVEPHRVVRLTLDSRGDSLVGSEILERLHPRYSEPTLGVAAGDALYYIANSQWERFGEAGEVARPEALEAPAILRLRL